MKIASTMKVSRGDQIHVASVACTGVGDGRRSRVLTIQGMSSCTSDQGQHADGGDDEGE